MACFDFLVPRWSRFGFSLLLSFAYLYKCVTKSPLPKLLSRRTFISVLAFKHYVLIGCLGVLGSCYLVYFKRDAFS